MKKNVANQSIGAEMITAADGTAFTGTVAVAYTIDGGTQTTGGGTAPSHEGNGYHSYTPLQAETNGDHVAFTFTGTGAIPATVQVYTNFPQTTDHTTPLATIDFTVNSILIDTDDLQTSQGNWLTATGFNTVVPPSVAQFNARTLLAADYFDPATDAVANVTLVGTTTTNTDMRGTDSANTVAPDNASITSILADTNELQTNQGNWLTATGFSTSAEVAALNDISVTDIFTGQMTESYAADGTAPTLAQSLFVTMQNLQDFSYAGTTQTVRKLDGSTTAATYTLDDATNPTTKTRTT